MKETLNLWQRCEQLGPMEDQGVQLYRTDSGDYRIFIDRATVFHVHQDGTIGDYCRAWLAEAILQRFEAITKQGGTSAELPTPESLPEPTYIVEAPKPTEPTQEQLGAFLGYVRINADSLHKLKIRISSRVEATGGDGIQLQSFDGATHLFATFDQLKSGFIGYTCNMPFDDLCRLIGFNNKEVQFTTIPTEQWVFEEPQQFVSIPVTEWQQLRQSLTDMQAILFPEVQPVEFES